MLRISLLHQKLQGMYSRINREQEIAESVFTNAIQISNIENPNIQNCIRPASTFSGDMILSAYAPSRDLFYMIGDFTGHGLSAALGALPVSEVFRAMVSKGFDGEDILTAINKKLKSLLPSGMFFGTQLVVVNHDLEHARIFNAGMPDILIVDGLNNTIKHRIKSRGLPLGIVESIDPKNIVQYVPIKQNDRNFMYSDGLTEARNQNDHELGEQRLEQAILGAADNNSFKQIFTDLDAFCGTTALADDVTLVEITCVHGLFPRTDPEYISQSRKERHEDRGDWSLSMRFNGARLRETNPIPILMNHIVELEGAHTERQALFTIMTELYVNALDHGVLGLNSSLKSDPSGFASYFEDREKKLKALDSGYVKFDIAIKKSDRVRNITIQLEDSGDGFDYKNYKASSDDLALSGRGILLLEELCDSLQYFGNGNIARAIFSWNTE